MQLNANLKYASIHRLIFHIPTFVPCCCSSLFQFKCKALSMIYAAAAVGTKARLFWNKEIF